jgi:hypothetical protein
MRGTAVKVTIYSYNSETGEDEVDGTISWAGGPLIFDPPDDPGLRSLQDMPVPSPNPEDEHPIHASENPGAWLANLYRGLTSPYLRASLPHA